MIGHLLLAFLMQRASSAILNNCKYNQHLQNGKMKLTSPGYPDPYDPGTTCQWTIESPPTTVINVECQISMSSMNDCNNNKVGISDNSDLISARYYCTSGQFTYTSRSGTLTILLETSSTAPGGTIFCTLEVQSSGPIHTTLIKVEEPIPPPKVDSPPVRLPAKCSCGRTNSMKITGGVETEVNQYPMMAGMFFFLEGLVVCGATIISEQYVLTAAHCFEEYLLKELGILVGGHDITVGTPYHEVYDISLILKHSDYQAKTRKNDIALVKSNSLILLSFGVGVACLPYNWIDFDFTGKTVTAAGWGITSSKGNPSSKLLQAHLKVILKDKCIDVFGPLIDDSKFCTFNLGKDACEGDSGGPIFWEDPKSGATVIVGVISNGIDCGSEFPGVNVKVSSYLDWIEYNTGETFCVI